MFGDKSRDILEMGIAGKIKILVSYDILKELADVLVGKKFRMSRVFVQQIVQELTEIAELVIVIEKISVIASDPDDNRILECAVNAKAQCIVSGDNHLLALEHFKKIKILTPSDFLSRLQIDRN